MKKLLKEGVKVIGIASKAILVGIAIICSFVWVEGYDYLWLPAGVAAVIVFLSWLLPVIRELFSETYSEDAENDAYGYNFEPETATAKSSTGDKATTIAASSLMKKWEAEKAELQERIRKADISNLEEMKTLDEAVKALLASKPTPEMEEAAKKEAAEKEKEALLELLDS